MLQVKTGKVKKTSKRTRNELFIGNIVKDINDKTVWLLIPMSSVNNGLSHFLGSQTFDGYKFSPRKSNHLY